MRTQSRITIKSHPHHTLRMFVIGWTRLLKNCAAENSTKKVISCSICECTEVKNYFRVKFVDKYFLQAAIEMIIGGDIAWRSPTNAITKTVR